MKLNFKMILIIFLVALLGSGLGTFGVLSLYNTNIKNNNGITDNVIINEVEYTNVEKSDYTKAIEKAYNTVVEITCEVNVATGGNYFFFGGGPSRSTSAGSGVIFSQDGYIVTNEHVIDGLTDESTIKVTLYNGQVYSARIIGYDVRTDLAVIKIDENNLPFASFVDSTNLMIGQDVIAIGNPLGLGISCSNGIVSALEKEIYINNLYMNVIQTNAAVNEGNSGGGLFDINGDLIGIVNAKKSASMTSNVEGMGYAIPSNTVIRIVNELINNGYVKDRAALGVRVYTSSAYYEQDGVLISEVMEGGSAQKAGIQENDIIISIDDVKISSYGDLSKFLDSKSVGDTVTVRVQRSEQQLDFKVILQSASNN